MSAVVAELLKARTARAPWGVGAGLLAIAALTTAGTVGSGSLDGRRALALMDAVEAGSLLALVLGVLLVTNEFRHRTITATFLVEPRRERVLAAKLAAGAIAGLAAGAAAAALSLAIALPWLSSRGEPLPLDGELLGAVGRVLAAYALAGAWGAAIGSAVHSQVGAIVGVFAWFLVLEPLVSVLVGLAADLDGNAVGRFLPGSAIDAVASDRDPGLLSPLAGLSVALLELASVFAAGVAVTLRRDIS